MDPFEGAVEQRAEPEPVVAGDVVDAEIAAGAFGDGAGGDEPFEDEPYEVPQPPVTGDAMVDDATRRVALAAREPLDVQVAVYDAVHRGLQDRLADVED